MLQHKRGDYSCCRAVTAGHQQKMMVYDAFHKFGRRWYMWGEIILKECKCVYLR